MNDDTPQPTAHPALQPVRGAAGTAITGLILVGAAWVVRAV